MSNLEQYIHTYVKPEEKAYIEEITEDPQEQEKLFYELIVHRMNMRAKYGEWSKKNKKK
jgi:hypothetical protein